jgi:hypothetical protein
MKSFFHLCLAAIVCEFCVSASGQLQLVPAADRECVFAGNARTIPVEFCNSSGQYFTGNMRIRIYQTSSATAVLISDAPWKNLEVPANETVLDAAALGFPLVKAKTKFLVQWLENTDRVIGTTDVMVYPTNLFQMLTPLDKDDFGIFDPNDRLKPLLRGAGIRFLDLGEMNLTNFTGKLVVIGPFDSKAQEPDDLAKRILAIAKKNVAGVWLQPPFDKNDQIKPSYYSVQKGRIAVVVAQSGLVSNLADNPQSQLNLIYFCNLALHPQPATLPDLTPQPET